MVVGTVKIKLYLHGVKSLKEKRSLVRKILHRVKDKFDVAGAETDLMDLHQSAEVGFALVTNESRFANSVMDKVVSFTEELYLAEVTDAEILITHL